MEEEERQAVMRLMLMFVVAGDRLAELGYDSRGVAGPVVNEVASFLGTPGSSTGLGQATGAAKARRTGWRATTRPALCGIQGFRPKQF